MSDTAPRPPMSDTDVPPIAPTEPVSAERHGSALVIRTPVKMLDGRDCDDIARLAATAPAAVTTIVLDLAPVRIIPSISIGALVRLDTECKKAGKTLKIAALAPQVFKVFKITRLDEVLHFSDTVECALA